MRQCIQDSNVIRVPQIQEQYHKPVVFDECCYEGVSGINGEIYRHLSWYTDSGQACVMGGYCTHGETYRSEDEILWWSKAAAPHGLRSFALFWRKCREIWSIARVLLRWRLSREA